MGVDAATAVKCWKIISLLACVNIYPGCDRTQSVFKAKRLCRETCVDCIRACPKVWKDLYKYQTIRFPEKKKLFSCQLQPYRNAGASPECLYFTKRFTNSSGIIQLAVDKLSRAICLATTLLFRTRFLACTFQCYTKIFRFNRDKCHSCIQPSVPSLY